jgi:Ca-activated chloride channel family protein
MRFLVLLCLLLPVRAQVVIWDVHMPRLPLPNPAPVRSDCRIRSVDVHASIQDQAAKVRISQVFQNPASVPMEAQVLFPLPMGAAVSALTLLVDGKEMTGRLIGHDEARRIYEDIVRRRRDPALLEYMGQDLFQTSVFPVPPGRESTVQIAYSQLLKKDSGMIGFSLPLGAAKHSARPVETLTVNVSIASTGAIRTIYSPTHQPEISRTDANHATARLTLHDVAEPDDFRVMYSTEAGPVGLNVLSYKPANEDGYFVLLATPETAARRAPTVPKTAVFLCDRSGSMSGPKIEQAKDALRYLVRQLKPGDTFNLITYDSEVESFRPELQRANPETIRAALTWVDGLNAGGGTNIDGAIRTGLRMLNDASRPNYLFFLTDGQPTTGETQELRIAANAAQENKVHARMFVFGVGFDVNGRLLDRLAREMRGQSVYVRPNENIEVPVSNLYAKVAAPVMTEAAVDIQLEGGTSRVYPRQTPDLFAGDQLVLVGRYRKGGPATVHLSGQVAGKKEAFTFQANFSGSADESDEFAARLWALRRIGDIIDELDLHGRNQELIDELVALSQRHGILTAYTSFLADDTVRLDAARANAAAAAGAVTRQLNVVAGPAAFAEREQKAQFMTAGVASAMPIAAPPSTEKKVVRQIQGKAFFQKQGIWQDSTVTAEQAKTATHVVQFSREYFDLASSHGGAMARYLAIDGPVLVNLGVKTYQIDPAPK